MFFFEAIPSRSFLDGTPIHSLQEDSHTQVHAHRRTFRCQSHALIQRHLQPLLRMEEMPNLTDDQKLALVKKPKGPNQMPKSRKKTKWSKPMTIEELHRRFPGKPMKPKFETPYPLPYAWEEAAERLDQFTAWELYGTQPWDEETWRLARRTCYRWNSSNRTIKIPDWINYFQRAEREYGDENGWIYWNEN